MSALSSANNTVLKRKAAMRIPASFITFFPTLHQSRQPLRI
jgi:hypothetical protein